MAPILSGLVGAKSFEKTERGRNVISIEGGAEDAVTSKFSYFPSPIMMFKCTVIIALNLPLTS